MTGPVVVHPYRSTFYINFRSTVVQRWAAKHIKGENYYTLTPTLWRKLGFKGLPEGLAGRASPSATIYFANENDAAQACEQVVEKLSAQGVIRP